jgi:DNA-binding NarL/FixJ family response regulator
MFATRSIAVVAEAEDFFNAGLAAMLQRDMGFSKVLRTSDYNGLSNLLTPNSDINLIVMQFDLPGAAGLTTIQELRVRQPGTPIAILCDRPDSRETLAMLAAGAHGIIPKQFGSCAELQRALRTIGGAGVFVPASLVEADDRDIGHDECEAGACSLLTSRQQQVISLVSEGHANKVIARELGISPSTVKVHVHAAFRALGVHSRLGAMAALRQTHRRLEA